MSSAKDESKSMRGHLSAPVQGEGSIPPLKYLSPAIFVPLEKSLLEPFDPPRDKLERLKVTLDRLDRHSDQVRQNLWSMFLRERDRILQDARKVEAAHGAQLPPIGIVESERDTMLKNMMAPPDPEKDYRAIHPLPTPSQPAVPLTTWRERAADELVSLVEGAIGEIDGFDMATTEVKEGYRQAIEREKASEARYLGNQESL
ncbi:hypothetical protein SODALDRAFT_327736 [Sodiomyces alkalinus F11]|uniref:Uncharacterized protein n=1 Tax=Sodiomyces alkalinus (strain CBS 110278 / VKM F-3762 / F11) TaxID=1314773 RepID=A0A3N2Q9U6_SODAK|nr:hypothetical protein SODALDRAFT_327736 [Sodiomyces alkalinus F11]ROT43529.1 hypothetical protein SODALDRAFT_327736 [Sodiomyces alkalinus F11]